jgi:hypothetical protein
MDKLKKAEYEKITAQMTMKKLDYTDPRAEWAVTTLRKKKINKTL